MNERDGFTFYRSYLEAAKELPDERRLEFYDAITLYGLLEKEPELRGIANALFVLVRPIMQKSHMKSRAGKAKGEQSLNKMKTEREQNANYKDIDYRLRIIDKDKDPPPTPPKGERAGAGKEDRSKQISKPKTRYAEFVTMTSDEHALLMAKLGEAGVKRCIEILDDYKGSSGKEYVSDYRTIRSWVVKRYEEERARAKSAQTAQGRPGSVGNTQEPSPESAEQEEKKKRIQSL